jgi:CRISPR/Cas system-associated exonuclease Cas4 (RecB family)
MNGGPISLDEAASEFTRAWTEKVESGGINWKTASECAELLTIGNDMVTLYHQKFSVSKFRAVEMEFRVPALSPDGFLIESHDLVGKIDAVSQGGAIIEVKTASKKPSQLECDMNMQLTAYSLSYRYLFGMPEEKIVLVSLIKTKEAQMEIIKTTRNEKRYIKLLHLMDLVLKCIIACMFYPNPLNVWGCRGCPYVGDCESKWPL